MALARQPLAAALAGPEFTPAAPTCDPLREAALPVFLPLVLAIGAMALRVKP